ncbi:MULTISPECIES: hypothetical protein [unclassified Sphingomonas]|uniref:hypothetical protein n=1 Tax=unclassified Sphingomonas TaxID=196159 RepID=UPI0006F3A92A|nr:MULTISPECIES: hypothetical protein [unclassified Sphingomonas]KQM60049.1 hypothetical protein ASE65_10105 [Sphingomonas sp. Leaf16]KQN11447.1 hypothetical protein ASE81_11090 [Sphingomonas sp. Leaf29]KQN18769.1 hypothetical protein ASE83_11030 [Sphingomonas sp. Leaf32]
MPYNGASELGGSVAAVPVTFTSGRQGKIPIVATVSPDGKSTSALPDGSDRSGTIAAGGAAQQLAPANPNRKVLTGQNLSSGDLWVNDLGVPAGPSAPSRRVPPGATFKANYAGAVSIWGATTGQAFAADEG